MAACFAQASIDENGKIAGGVAGNQNGKELNTCSVYASSSKPWLFSVIPLNEAVRAEMNRQAKAGVANPYIGYDQYQRNTILIQAKKVGWDLSKITVACECDCSSFLATVMICAVYKVLGQAAGDMVYNALYAGGNLPATGNFKSKLASLGAYFTTALPPTRLATASSGTATRYASLIRSLPLASCRLVRPLRRPPASHRASTRARAGLVMRSSVCKWHSSRRATRAAPLGWTAASAPTPILRCASSRPTEAWRLTASLAR